MPELDGIDALREISEGHPIPAVVVSGYHDSKTLERAEDDHVLAYLIKPIREADLQASIAVAMRQHEESESLRQGVVDLLNAMDDRQIVTRAMQVLTELGVDEQAAADRLRKLARKQNCPLVEAARRIVAIEDRPTKS
jgi:response regulator NasT